MSYQEEERQRLEWLKALKVGDEVAITGHWHPVISKVTRFTETRIIVGASAYNKKNGYGYGARGMLHPVTQDMRDEAEKRAAVYRLSRTNWQRIPLEHLRAVLQALPKEEAQS